MTNFHSYQDALDYVYSFVDYSRTHQQNLAPENFDLSRVRKLMALLGNPERRYPSIHVAGSKGKGSVCAFCSSVLIQNGYKVGLYTSPHMVEFTERIQINGEQIGKGELVDLVNQIKPYIEKIKRITTFEIITALGFMYFSQQKVDLAVIEVGLGGRLDATNVILPKVSVITQLYLEHTQILGNTLEQIANEKGGIIKPHVPVVISQQKSESLEMLLSIAKERSAPVYLIGKDYIYQISSYDLSSQTIWVFKNGFPEEKVTLKLPLLGDFQAENAATAYAALDVLRDTGISIKDEAIKQGFNRTLWQGRFEILQKAPPVVLDSAHNKDASIKLIQTIHKYFPDRKVILVFGVSADKNIQGMLDVFKPFTRLFICTQSTHPRALETDALLNLAKGLNIDAIGINDVPKAFQHAIGLASENDIVVVTGSIFVVAAARTWWKKNHRAG